MAEDGSPRPQGPLLFVAERGDVSFPALLRAAVLARGRGSALVVTAALSRRGRWLHRVLGLEAPVVSAAPGDGEALRATLAVRRRVEGVPGVALGSAGIHVWRGELVGAVVAAAARLTPALVVLPGTCRDAPGAASAIVERARVAVLVARQRQPSARVVAASDLTLERFPVLAAGVALGDVLDAPVTFVHNVAPLGLLPFGPGLDAGSMVLFGGGDSEGRIADSTHQLAEAAAWLRPDAETLVASAGSTIEAIVAAAAERRADVIVVGHRRSSWFEGLIGGGVAAEVVRRAPCSVLVVPLPDEEPSPA